MQRNQRLNVKKKYVRPQTSSAVAPRTAVKEWYDNIKDLAVAIALDDPTSQHSLAHQHSLAYQALVQAAVVVSIAGAAYIPVAAPAGPPNIDAGVLGQINMQYTNLENTYVAVAGALPGATVCPVFELIEKVNEQDFHLILGETLEAMAHSGFAGHGTYNQIVEFKLYDHPQLEDFYELEVSEIIASIPQGFTPRQIGAYHANVISYWLKDNDVMTDWAKRHGVPAHLNHLGHAVWQHISDKNLLNEQQRATMSLVTAISIRDQTKDEVLDPHAPVDVDAARKSAANYALAQHQYNQDYGYRPESSTSQHRRK